MGQFKILLQTGSKLVRQQVCLRSTVAAIPTAEVREEYSEEWQRARPFEEIPTESTFRMVRKFMPGGKFYKKDLNELMWAIQKEYGDIFLSPKMFGREPVLYTYNPEDFEKVFRNEGIWPSRPGFEVVVYYRNKYRADYFQGIEGLVSTSGKQWGSFRTAVNPVLMQPRNVKLYLNKMSQVNQEFVDRIRKIRDPTTLEAPTNFKEEINRWTLESVSVVAMDKQLGLLKDDTTNNRIKDLFNSLDVFFQLGTDLELEPSLWKYIATPKFKKLMNAMDTIRETILYYVNEALERLEREHAAGKTRPEHEQSVLEKLLKLDKKIATVMAMDMLMAGVDTTTSAFTSVMLCLSKYPEHQSKVREEVRRVLPNKDSEFPENALEEMPYLRAFIKEAMRVYPLATANSRLPQKNVTLSGYRVPSGTAVLMVSTTLLNDERYFSRGKEFIPERWMRNNNELELGLKATNPFVYLPFGFGSRSCIGKRIVEMELLMGVARIVRNFHVEFNYPTDNVFKGLIINMPNVPLKFKFTDINT